MQDGSVGMAIQRIDSQPCVILHHFPKKIINTTWYKSTEWVRWSFVAGTRVDDNTFPLYSKHFHIFHISCVSWLLLSLYCCNKHMIVSRLYEHLQDECRDNAQMVWRRSLDSYLSVSFPFFRVISHSNVTCDDAANRNWKPTNIETVA